MSAPNQEAAARDSAIAKYIAARVRAQCHDPTHDYDSSCAGEFRTLADFSWRRQERQWLFGRVAARIRACRLTLRTEPNLARMAELHLLVREANRCLRDPDRPPDRARVTRATDALMALNRTHYSEDAWCAAWDIVELCAAMCEPRALPGA